MSETFQPGSAPGPGNVTPPRRRSDTPSGLAAEYGDLHRLLVESVQDYAIFALDPNGYILSWNAGAERFKGYRGDEIIGKHFSVFYPQEKIDSGFPDHELEVAAQVGRFEDEGWRIRKDGTRFWANVVITALRDEGGRLVAYAKVTRDLSDRRRAEEALRQSEQRFRLLVQGVRDYAIFMLDPSGRVATWNEGAERIKGYSQEEILGQHFSRFYTAEDIADRKPPRELEIATREGQYGEEGWRVRKDGTLLWANVLITALRDESGTLVGFAKVTRDLTERRKAEEKAMDDMRRLASEEAARHMAEERARELRQLAEQLHRQAGELEARSREAEGARSAAEEANKAKSQFLAAMSHELRTPLNAIGGYADLMAMEISGPVTAKQREQLERIRRSQQHLMGIINDILNFSRIEAGHLDYDIGPVPLDAVVQPVAHMIAPQAEEKRIQLDVACCAPELVARADRPKVEQILLNLLSNAVKFTDAGGTIRIAARGTADTVLLLVTDTGVGIAPEQQEAVFEPFVQVGRSLSNMREGTGLGLAISRDLARAMGGELTLESTMGQGSTFTLVLPRA